MHSFKGNVLLEMALIVTIMICTFGPGVGVEGLKCYSCRPPDHDQTQCKDVCKAIQQSCNSNGAFCLKIVSKKNEDEVARSCSTPARLKAAEAKSGGKFVFHKCSDKDLCNGDDSGASACGGSGRLDSNVGLLIGLLMSGISFWFVIESSSSGRLSSV